MFRQPVVGRQADGLLQRGLHQFGASLPGLQLRQRAVRRGVELVEPQRLSSSWLARSFWSVNA